MKYFNSIFKDEILQFDIDFVSKLTFVELSVDNIIISCDIDEFVIERAFVLTVLFFVRSAVFTIESSIYYYLAFLSR